MAGSDGAFLRKAAYNWEWSPIKEHDLAIHRISDHTAPSQLKISRDIFSRVFKRWHWYLFVSLWTVGNQCSQVSGSPFSLYLKANEAFYSITRIDTLPTMATAISIVTAFITCSIADRIGRFWPLLLIVSIPTVVSHALLVAWNVGETGRVVAFSIGGFQGAVFPLTMSCATITMVNDAEERAVVTASMNAIGQAISAWSQLLQFPAIEAPRFEKGFLGGLVTSVVQMLNVLVIVWCPSRDRKKVPRRTLGEQTNSLAEFTYEKSSAAHQAQPTTNEEESEFQDHKATRSRAPNGSIQPLIIWTVGVLLGCMFQVCGGRDCA